MQSEEILFSPWHCAQVCNLMPAKLLAGFAVGCSKFMFAANCVPRFADSLSAWQAVQSSSLKWTTCEKIVWPNGGISGCHTIAPGLPGMATWHFAHEPAPVLEFNTAFWKSDGVF